MHHDRNNSYVPEKIPMSPLGEAIYHILVQRVGLANPLLTYHDLVNELRVTDSQFDDIGQHWEHLFRTLGEVGRACRDWGLPTLTALVVRGGERSPGSGYYQMFHPEVGNDPAKQKEAWEKELGKVTSTTFPLSFEQDTGQQLEKRVDKRKALQPLGYLRLADKASRPALVFSGEITCPHCSAAIGIEVVRNPSAVSPKQPPFAVIESAPSAGGRTIGHLFIGTIMSSPKLYYGSVEHCGSEHWIAVFYNRSLRDREDNHLTIMPSLSGSTGEAVGENEQFRLS